MRFLCFVVVCGARDTRGILVMRDAVSAGCVCFIFACGARGGRVVRVSSTCRALWCSSVVARM